MTKQIIKLAVLISGSGSNLQAIIDQIDQDKLAAQIVCVVSNNPDAFGLKRAETHDIPFFAVPHKHYSNTSQFESAISTVLNEFQPDLIILAGFMRILSEKFVNKYENRILNIHPSLLPDYKGLNTHARVLAAGEEKHGATVHVVTSKLDSGEIIIQQSCDIDTDDDEDTLQQKVHRIEHVIYPQAIKEYSKSKFISH